VSGPDPPGTVLGASRNWNCELGSRAAAPDRLFTDRRDRRIFNRGSYWYCHAPDGYCANTELLTYTTHDITCRTVPAQHNDKQKKYYDTTERSTGTGTCEGAFRRDDGA